MNYTKNTQTVFVVKRAVTCKILSFGCRLGVVDSVG